MAKLTLDDEQPTSLTDRRSLWRARQPKEKLRQIRRLSKSRSVEREYAVRPILAVDGEGVTTSEGHFYTLLAGSDGGIVRSTSLKTTECLAFLLRYSGRLVVGFAFSYDVNLMIRDLTRSQLLGLHRRGYCYLSIIEPHSGPPAEQRYRISYVPRKCFTISRQYLNASGKGRWQTAKTVTVWDTFGFFQCSFVKALKEWKVGTPEEVAFLVEMKAKRADFTTQDAAKVERYNQLECTLLVKLVEALRDTLVKAGIKLNRWDGAGAIAAALLKANGVRKHIAQGHPTEVMNAYFGGRIQVLQLGEIDGPVYNYDINSAYPWVAADLPSLHGTWKRVDSYNPSPWAIWRCKWAFQEPSKPGGLLPVAFEPLLTPFPVRSKTRNIHYPLVGEGWYWGPLVDLAVKHWAFDILEGYVFEPDLQARPFDFIRQAYAERVVYKLAADPRHIVLKLGLNSLYGKTAQGVGFRGNPPPFRSYVWAGLITATAQARLLEAALECPDEIVAFATDGVYSRRRLNLNLDNSLGGWEETIYDRMVIFQPGLYLLYKGDKPQHKTRGYHPSELDWDKMIKLWRKGGSYESVEFKVTRFLTLGVSLQTHRLKDWGKWCESPRKLHLRPATGFPGLAIDSCCIRWYPDFVVEGGSLSEPYVPKRGQYDAEQDVRRSEELEQPEPLV